MLRIYFMLKNQYLKTAMEYTFNFWMMFIAGVVMRTLMMGVAFVLFQSMPTIAGFTEGEVYLIMSLMFISEGMCNIFFDGIWHLTGLVHTGQFDIMLSRPVSPLYQLLSYELGLQGLGVIAMGVVSLVLAANSLGWISAPVIGLLLVFILLGMVLRASSYLLGVCNVFFLNTGGQINITYTLYSIGEYAKYPVNIYPGWMQAILLSIIPYGFIGYVPVLILRGEQPLMWFALLVVVTVLYAWLARFVFYRGIRRYESMGM